MKTGSEIVADFVSRLEERGLKISKSSISQNVFLIYGSVNALLYIKGRAGIPYRRGVTKNVVTRLNQQRLKWFVVLLYESEDHGYFLTADDVGYYIRTTWPIGKDGDYKPATGSYLANHSPFSSIDQLLSLFKRSLNTQ